MFRTELKTKTSLHPIQSDHNIISLGSCFAEHIGTRLYDHKFNVQKNPFGIVFNPLSIFELVETAFYRSSFSESSFLERDGIHFNFKAHSELNAKSETELESKINTQRNRLKKALGRSNFIILTFGTAWVYEQKKTRMLVANCHKVPATEFNKRLLSTEEITSSFMALKELLQTKNPELKFILSVSPVRHIKDTIELNAVSKSVLRLACHHISQFTDDVSYFPAYEFMMDDLRDYRFYDRDMIHPNTIAIEYIWQKFQTAYFDNETQLFIKEWSEIKSALNHKPFHPQSAAHQKFLCHTIDRLEKLKDKVNVKKEIENLKAQLA